MKVSDGPATGFAHDIERHWVRLTLIAWAVLLVWFVWQRWDQIQWLGLGDTDDNMRLMQVRALLNGQGWYDLRQYRMNPPIGSDIHWSRLVDLPIAGLILILKPFVGMPQAERLACGIAPLLPLSLAMVGLAASVRRLVDPRAWPVAILFLMCCTVTLLMFMPMRIDHHGWQLAMLSLTVAGLCDQRQVRGGAIVGAASAVSLAIGLEMLPYCVMAAVIVTLRWVWDRAEAPRLQVYALTLGGGTAIGYALFASYADRVLRCDALTPVWLSVFVVAGSLLFLAARLSPASRAARLALSVAAGAVVVIGFALVFPQCLGRPEQVSDELYRNWLSNIREAKPIYKHPFRTAFPIVALPIVGLLGAIWATVRAGRSAMARGWVPVALFSAFACAMLLWQARAGPAAQLLAVPGAVALAWIVFPKIMGSRFMLVRVFGSVFAFLAVTGLFAGLSIKWFPIDRPDKRTQIINTATGKCPTLSALAPLDRYPPAVIFTFIDLGPRLITITHHDAVAGPYHRNGDAILDVQHAFGGSPQQFLQIAHRHGASLLLICPNMAESTNYRARNPGGFYDRIAKGEKFPFLEPLALPRKSPLRLYRIDYGAK